MKVSNHLRRVLYAAGGVTAVIVLSLAARFASERAGGGAGAAGIAVVFASCGLIFGAGSLLHPAPARRKSRGRDPETDGSPVTLTETSEPARLAA